MNTAAFITSIFYIAGIGSCAAQGAEKAPRNNVAKLYYIANAFGGGFIRDVLLLQVHPWLLTLSALPDTLLAIAIGTLYTTYLFTQKAKPKVNTIIKWLITITDTLGLGSFICIGMDKAFSYSDNIILIIACGYITAIGGGLLASGQPILEIVTNREAVRYHSVVIFGCCYYYLSRHSLSLIYFVAIGIFLGRIDYKSLYSLYSNKLINPYFKIFLLYPAINNRNHDYRNCNSESGNRLSVCSCCTKIYLIQHRIRQC